MTTQLSQGPRDKVLNGTALLDFYLFHQPLINSTSTKPVALECTLRFCIQTYETSVNSGDTITSLTSTNSSFTPHTRGSLVPFLNATVGGVNFSVEIYTSQVISGYLSPMFTGSCFSFFSETGQEPDFSCNGTDTAEAFGMAVNLTSGLASDVKNAIETLLNNTAISMTNA